MVHAALLLLMLEAVKVTSFHHQICRGKRAEQFRREKAPPANEPGRVPKEGNGPLARKLRSECRHLKHE
jgi:hypothetical protein